MFPEYNVVPILVLVANIMYSNSTVLFNLTIYNLSFHYSHAILNSPQSPVSDPYSTPDFFGLCPRCQKNYPEKLSKIVVDGGGWRSDYEKFLLDSILPTKLAEFPTKLTEFVPFIFIISQYCPTLKRILSDWLCLPNKLGGGCRPLRSPPGTPISMVSTAI